MISEIRKIEKNINSKKMSCVHAQDYENATNYRSVERDLNNINNFEDLEFFIKNFHSTYCKIEIFNEILKEVKPLFGILRKMKIKNINK